MSKHVCPHVNQPIFSKGRCKSCTIIDFGKKQRKKIKVGMINNILSPVANKRSVLNKIYSEIRISFLKEHTTCGANLEGCTRKSTEIHHKAGRQFLFLICSKFFLPVCRSCHIILTKNSQFSIENNFSLSRKSNIHIELNKIEVSLLEKYNYSH